MQLELVVACLTVAQIALGLSPVAGTVDRAVVSEPKRAWR
jgi:hypothetical protein